MAQYIDYAEYYDFDHAMVEDIPFYLSYARDCGSPILELACGTGRVLISMAEEGFTIYGLDSSENMLALCRRKVEDKALGDRVHLFEADMGSFQLPRQDFGLCYIPVRAFMHLFTQRDQLGCLVGAFDHLRPGGRLIVDLYAPDFARLAQAPNQPFAFRKAYSLPNGHRVIRQDRFVQVDLAHQITYTEMRFEEYSTGGELVRQRSVPVYTRFTLRYELQLLLERSGFVAEDWFRDYTRRPFDGSGEIIAVARRPE